MLARGDSVSIIFLLNTAEWSRGRHLIAAYAHPAPSEFDVDNNARTCDPVTVTISGDVNGDFAVGILDVVMITSGTCSKPETHDSNLTATSTTTAATSTSLIWSSAQATTATASRVRFLCPHRSNTILGLQA